MLNKKVKIISGIIRFMVNKLVVKVNDIAEQGNVNLGRPRLVI